VVVAAEAGATLQLWGSGVLARRVLSHGVARLHCEGPHKESASLERLHQAISPYLTIAAARRTLKCCQQWRTSKP